MGKDVTALAKSRTIKIGPSKGGGKGEDIKTTNVVITSKYTPVTFVPKNLFEQLHKWANMYFVLISIVMWIGEKTPLFVGTIKAWSTAGMLAMMMTVSALTAALDDRKRHVSDAHINGQVCKVAVASANGTLEFVPKKWSDIRVADMVLLEGEQEVPADMVPLSCSGDEGVLFVSTASLDGETNLKGKGSAHCTQKAWTNSGEGLNFFKGSIEAEAPQQSIYNFTGRLSLDGQDCEALDGSNLLLRGCLLRNTKWCLGCVVYTGKDTRMAMNSRAVPLKVANIERVTNEAMIVVLAVQALVAFVSDFMFNVQNKNYLHFWYLFPDGGGEQTILPGAIAYWFTFFTLYSNLMPVSLYASMEVVNQAHAYFIKNDKDMYYAHDDCPAVVRASNLCAEVGQVSYIFSDKTGTLTQNVMQLKRVHIAGKTYGQMSDPEPFDGGSEFKTAKAKEDARRNSPTPDTWLHGLPWDKFKPGTPIHDFFECLAVAHTVNVSDELGPEGRYLYEAESPDEEALVDAVGHLGWVFAGRKGYPPNANVTVEEKTQATVSNVYTILAVNAFNSTRKRMSVVVLNKATLRYYVMVKGADNVMLDRASFTSEEDRSTIDGHLTRFSNEGLRTLVIGRKELEKEDVDAWYKKFEAAQASMSNREQALMDVAEEIETGLTVLGVTAIEDKLQDGVAETIKQVREAGVKLWVLTGDKLETAREIGFSTNVLDANMSILILDDFNKVHDHLETATSQVKRGVVALMVTGQAIEGLMEDAVLRGKLLELAKLCSVVIACRVSPLQKAQMVRLVREGIKPTPVTLAIGDGANDVPMIQEAQVGVGISGREGRQAVNASDFAIGQFKYLGKLLLVHGSWNYWRACSVILYTFWRNAVQVVLMFMYTFYSGYSGTALFEDSIRISFNAVCTIAIMAVGFFDRRTDAETAMRNPKLYEIGRMSLCLNRRTMAANMLCALLHSAVIAFLSVSAIPGLNALGLGDYYTFCTFVYTLLVTSMNYRVAFLATTWNKWLILFQVCSFFCYAGFLLAVITRQAGFMHGAPIAVLTSQLFWISVVAMLALAFAVDLVKWYLLNQFGNVRMEKLIHDAKQQEGSAIHAPVVRKASSGSLKSRTSLPIVNPKTQIKTDALAQQKDVMFEFNLTGHRVKFWLLLLGLFLAGLGYWAQGLAESAAQIRIRYDGDMSSDDGVRLDGTVDHSCPVGSSCVVKVKVPKDMGPRIVLSYVIDPFYQNYNSYLKSVVPQEMLGLPVTAQMFGLRGLACSGSNAKTANGDWIVPCGLEATSLFNDTFEVTGESLVETGIAWASDIARFQNPVDYLKRPLTSWLYQRYPEVVPEKQGVTNEHFMVWMRSAAMPTLVKPYGFIDGTHARGSELSIHIEAKYPVSTAGANKYLVLTTVNALGGPDGSLHRALTRSGFLCIGLGLLVFLNELCPYASAREGRQVAACDTCADGGDASDSSESLSFGYHRLCEAA